VPRMQGEVLTVRRPLTTRVAIALAVFGAAHVWISREHHWNIQNWILERGQAAGCTVVQLGYIVMGQDGPFFGDDPKNRAWNFAYRNAPWLAAAFASYAAAMAAYTLAAGPLGRTRLFGYRGPTCCGSCGYQLRGLNEPKCPECGTPI
jgi:hypothetical protein